MTFSFAACDQTNTADSSNSNTPGLKKVIFMLSWAPDTNHIGVYMAKNKGYFKDAGLNADIVAVARASAEQAVNNGVADFVLSSLTNVGVYTLKGAHTKQVLQVQQKLNAIWCALVSDTAIKFPKDLDGKTFTTFGSSESDAAAHRMIQTGGGKGELDKVTVDIFTFQIMGSGKADFGGFHVMWEGVQVDMYDPKLNCFAEPDYSVPGNADTIGIITNDKTTKNNSDLIKKFTQATQKGYGYTYADPDDVAQILMDEVLDADLKPEFIKENIQVTVSGQYWGDLAKIKDGSFVLGTNDFKGAQKYFDFLIEKDAYTDSHDKIIHEAPQAKDFATDEFIGK